MNKEDEFENFKNKLKDLSKCARENGYKQASDGLNNAVECFEVWEPKLKAQILKEAQTLSKTENDNKTSHVSSFCR